MRAVAVLAAAVLGTVSGRAAACEIVDEDPRARVEIADESALLVWDPVTKEETFVRRSSFRSEASSFGFLVPTPTPPVLGEVDDAVFARLEELLVPDTEWVMPMYCAGGEDDDGEAPGVRVVRVAHVGGYDAAVLEVKRADALATWLEKNRFPTPPTLAGWVEPYVARGWTVTAFRFEPKGEASFHTRAVSMKFRTDEPFYPYRETPRPPTGRPRRLRVYLLSFGTFTGSVRDWSGVDRSFPGAMVWSGPVDLRWLFQGKLELSASSRHGDPALTVFEDASSPRPGAGELFFRRLPTPIVTRPAPVRRPVDLLVTPLLFFATVLALFLGVRRLTARKPAR